MNIPDNIKIRLLLTVDEAIFKRFYWFEMKNSDFYWGSAYKTVRSSQKITNFSGTEFTITVPDDFHLLPRQCGKYSYHESGSVHYKYQTENGLSIYEESSNWCLKSEIKQPIIFYSFFSRVLKNYNKTIVDPIKNNSNAIVLKFNSENFERRVYFEFLLSPEGTFEVPKPLIKMDGEFPGFVTNTVSKDLILVIRFAVVPVLAEWHPDKEIVIMPDKLI